MLSFATYSAARVQQISTASADGIARASPFVEDSFDRVADPVCTLQPGHSPRRAPQSLPSFAWAYGAPIGMKIGPTQRVSDYAGVGR
jgi:hypothetical protein